MAMEPFFTTFGPLATQYWGSAAPSLATDIGPFNVGDVVWNTEPAAGEALCWICTTAGATGATAVFSAIGVAGGTATAADLAKLHAITASAATLNNAVAGAAAGYKIAKGVTNIDAASKDIATGLATVTAVVVSMTADPSLTHSSVSATVGDQAGAPAAGSIRVRSWKPTAANDCTLIAASAPYSAITWVAIGT